MSGITLSAGVRQNLLSLQDTAALIGTTRTVSPPARGQHRPRQPDQLLHLAGARQPRQRPPLPARLDRPGAEDAGATDKGITSLTALVQSAKSIARQAASQPRRPPTRSARSPSTARRRWRSSAPSRARECRQSNRRRNLVVSVNGSCARSRWRMPTRPTAVTKINAVIGAAAPTRPLPASPAASSCSPPPALPTTSASTPARTPSQDRSRSCAHTDVASVDLLDRNRHGRRRFRHLDLEGRGERRRHPDDHVRHRRGSGCGPRRS